MQSSKNVVFKSQGVKQLIDQQLKCAFHMFDMKGNGTIKVNDFGTLMRSLGFNISQDIALQLANKIDIEGREVITYQQFQKYLMHKLMAQQTVKQFQKAFKVMDIDADGYISAKDLGLFLESVGQSRSEDDIKEMMKQADVDGDDHITYQEFIRLMMTH